MISGSKTACYFVDQSKRDNTLSRSTFCRQHFILTSKGRKMLLKLTFLCVLSLSSAAASDVLEFTDADFSDKIVDHDIILVEFFAPWCGHCKRLAPEYEKAATTLKSNDPPVALAKVDCTANKDVCGKYGVSGYPTLKIFKAGGESTEDYNGPREADGIVKYMKGRAGPASKELKTVKDVEDFLDKFEHACVGFLSKEDSEVAKTFKKVADSMSTDMRFGHSTSSEVTEKFGYNDEIVFYPPKRLHSKFEPKEVKYEGDVKVSKIKSWIEENKIGLCPHRTAENSDKIKTRPLVVVYYEVDYVKNVKGTNYWRNRVMKVAQKFKEADKEIQFAISSFADFGHEMSEFGMEQTDQKKLYVTGRNSKDQKFVMEGEFSMDALEKFANDLLDDKLEPYMKSEPVPTSQEAVKVAVAKNFDEIVADEKDVLIEFYAPWCGHCKSLEPKYKELAEKLEDEPNLVIAKMDATANDVPSQYDVRGFPTIYFKPKGSSPKRYEGGREVKDFIKYLAKESTDGLEKYSKDGKKKKSQKQEL